MPPKLRHVIALSLACTTGACISGSAENLALPPEALTPLQQDPATSPNQQTPEAPIIDSPNTPAESGPIDTAPVVTNPNLPPGTVLNVYGYMASALDPFACLDRPVGATVSPGQYVVQMFACNYTDPQTFVYTSDGSLRASDANRCLTLPDPGGAATNPNLANITVRACSSAAPNQKWDYTAGTWRSRGSMQCLDIVSGDPSSESRLYAAPCSNARSQQWLPLTNPNTPVADPLASKTTVAERCSPNIGLIFAVGDANAQYVQQNLPNFEADVRQAALEVCAIAFAKASDVPNARSTMLIKIRPSSEVGVAYSIGHEIDIGFDYLADQIRSNQLKDVRGMLRHEITHYYQQNNIDAPGWLIEGMAEFVRFKAGYVNAVPTRGKPYTDGYAASGFFLIWLEDKYAGFFNHLMVDMQKANSAWGMDYFLQKTGTPFDDLWRTYQATL